MAMQKRMGSLLAGMLAMGLVTGAYAAGELSGNISLDLRFFGNDAIHAGQDDESLSIAFEPEYYYDWANGKQRFVFAPFLRYDANDDERTHADIRELYWRGTFNDVDLKIGVAEVFWGVTESQHLVDIINQKDAVENIDGEDRLGQPMVNLSLTRDWGTLDLFVLPYFRERTFPGREGRLRSSLVVDTDNPIYESGAEENHVDFAVRWSHYIGNWDIGIAHFSGTSREPLFALNPGANRPVLLPVYRQIDQTSLDLQATYGDWAWKLEAIYNQNDIEDYSAAVAGFEYTLVGLAGSATDLGLLLEYHYDERDDGAPTFLENDVFAGVRWVLNDAQSSELLLGAIMDADSSAWFGNLEASRRFGNHWKVTLEARIFANMPVSDPLYEFRDDDYLEIQIARFF